MLIQKVELKNIKPYKDRSFEFAPGINVLSGPNGAGKSTVFEAIGYALFGVDAQAFIGKAERFVRKGAKHGRVRVHFKTDDGQRYVIERRAGTQSVWRLAEKKDDETEDFIEVKNSQELERELTKILFQKDRAVSGKLADHFLNVIGPLQNEFLGPFVKKGQSRINQFDRILGISAWREAYKKGSQLESEVKSIIQQREAVLREKQTQVLTYDQVVEELAAASKQLAGKKDRLATVSNELKQAAARLGQFDAAKAKLERLEREYSSAQREQGQLEVKKQAAERNLGEAQAAKRVCQQQAQAHAAYRQAEQQLTQLRRQQRQADAVQKKVDALEKEIERLSGQIGSEERGLAEQADQLRANLEEAEHQLTRIEKQMEEIQTEEQRAQADQAAYKEFADRLAELDTVASLRQTALQLIDDLLAVKQEIAGHQLSLKQKEALQREARREESTQQQVDALTAELASLDARKKQFQEGNQKLSSGQCPFFEETCLNLQSKAQPPADFFGARIAELESQRQGITAQVSDLKQRLERARDAKLALAKLDEVENQLQMAEQRAAARAQALEETLRPVTEGSLIQGLRQWIQTAPDEPQQSKLHQVVEQLGPSESLIPEAIEHRKSAIERFAEQWQGLMAELKQILKARLAELDQRVNQLRQSYAAANAEARKVRGDRRKYQKDQQRIADKRAALQQQKETLADRQEKRDALVQQAKQFEHVPGRIEEQEEVLAGAREGYSAYERNKKQAEQVERLEREIKEIDGALNASAEKLARLRAELESCRAGYDEKAHEQVKRQQTELTAQQAGLTAEVENLKREVTRLKAERARMDDIRKEIGDLEADIRRYRKTQEFVHDLRSQVFNRVSEQLSERFREQVSHMADRIYRVIAASDEELRWGSGYSIELVDFQQGKERVRSDEELSGGEMMNAVVALRLALLQTTGSKIGFFDEPTSNLDEFRRANLAQAFRSLDVGQDEVGQPWYDQLFLISHDVAFTEITDQIIHLGEGEPG